MSQLSKSSNGKPKEKSSRSPKGRGKKQGSNKNQNRKAQPVKRQFKQLSDEIQKLKGELDAAQGEEHTPECCETGIATLPVGRRRDHVVNCPLIRRLKELDSECPLWVESEEGGICRCRIFAGQIRAANGHLMTGVNDLDNDRIISLMTHSVFSVSTYENHKRTYHASVLAEEGHTRFKVLEHVSGANLHLGTWISTIVYDIQCLFVGVLTLVCICWPLDWAMRTFVLGETHPVMSEPDLRALFSICSTMISLTVSAVSAFITVRSLESMWIVPATVIHHYKVRTDPNQDAKWYEDVRNLSQNYSDVFLSPRRIKFEYKQEIVLGKLRQGRTLLPKEKPLDLSILGRFIAASAVFRPDGHRLKSYFRLPKTEVEKLRRELIPVGKGPAMCSQTLMSEMWNHNAAIHSRPVPSLLLYLNARFRQNTVVNLSSDQNLTQDIAYNSLVLLVATAINKRQKSGHEEYILRDPVV